MGEESEEVQIIALCDALGVPIRVVYLDRSSRSAEDLTANHHDFFPSANNDLQNNGSNETDVANVSTDLSKQENPVPFVTLLYRPGHYDILYPIWSEKGWCWFFFFFFVQVCKISLSVHGNFT